jgi:hypothetical protein
MNCYSCDQTATGVCAHCHIGLCNIHGKYKEDGFFCKDHNTTSKIDKYMKIQEKIKNGRIQRGSN